MSHTRLAASLQLPISRIKKIIKQDEEIKLISTTGASLIAKATVRVLSARVVALRRSGATHVFGFVSLFQELFIAYMGKKAYENTLADKRKTMSVRFGSLACARLRVGGARRSSHARHL